MMAPEYIADRYRSLITRCTVLLCLCFMLWRAAGHSLICQLEQPVLFHTGYDLSYWLIRTLQLDAVLLHWQPGSVAVVVLFFASGLLLLLWPQRRIWAFIFAATYLLQVLLLNIYICKTPHVQAGFAVLLWSFCARRFGQWWELMRYYVCYIFSTAFLWKLYYGSFFHWNDGFLFFREHVTPYLFHYPDTAIAFVYRWLLQHPFLVNINEKLIFIAQGLFFAGFFTRKYDRFFSVFLILFIITLLLFGHHFFVEFLVLLLPLCSCRDWKRLSDILFRMQHGKAGQTKPEPII